MDKHVTKNQRLARVEKVINEMGLSKCADTLIGTPGRIKGISGGEMKRLSFASEILTNPALMFCDEPTSGLDSFMAQNIVQTLQTMAAKGRTIICTIHQPSSEVFNMFDQLLILAEGRVAYMGPSSGAIPFFKSQGLTCPSNYNPADFYIHTLAIVNGKEKECRTRVEQICDAYEKSEQAAVINRELEEFVSDHHDLGDAWVDMSSIRRYKGSWCKQFAAVFWRSWLGNFRDPNLQKIRLLQSIVIGVILGLVYLRQEYNQEAIQNLNGALFLIITNMSFSNMFAVINSFPMELPIFMREHGSRLYRVDVYFISKTIAELPNFIVFPAVFCAVIYWMIGFYEAVEQFFIFMAIMIFVANIAVSVGYVISCMTGSLNIALAIAPPLLIPLMLFGGFYVNTGTVPVYFVWLEYLSWFKYSNEIVTINQWKDVTDLACPNNTLGQRPCFTNGQEVLDSLNFSNDNITLDLGLMAALLVGYRVLAFLLLLLRSRKL
ncbi:protein white-like [Liolophura sinensis]|uniref:protein white-like n=1 Tax=Liolophura sinensis TaxID=3198878 RepID=UPI0031580A4A